MKEIYVVKSIFGGYEPLTEDRLEQIEKGNSGFIGMTLVSSNPDVTIHVYEECLMLLFADEEYIQARGKKVAEDYLSYVESITGLDVALLTL